MKIYYNWLLGHCNVAIKISIWILVFKIRLTNSLNIFSHIQPRLNKFVLLRLEAYNSGLEAGIGTCRDIFGFLRFSAFI